MSLFALHLFLRACDEDDFTRAVLAGFLAGVAIETKYTGFVAVSAMVFAGALFRRWRLVPAAMLTTAQVFVSWELLTAMLYDHSHFFNCASGQTIAAAEGGLVGKVMAVIVEKQVFLPVLFTLVGGVSPALILLGLAALDCGRRCLGLAAGVLFFGILAIAFDYAQVASRLQACLEMLSNGIRFSWDFKLSDAIFLFCGLAQFSLLVAIIWRLIQAPLPRAASAQARMLSHRRVTMFLVLWLVMEILGYFMMTPFPAVRRVLGITVVASLLTGRLIATTCHTDSARRNLLVVLWGGIFLGLAYFTLDFANARAQQVAANEAADWIQQRGGARVWYAGHWGFQYYAEHRGMMPLFVGSETVQPGDYLAIPDKPHNQQAIELDLRKVVEEHQVIVEDMIPLSTVPNFYGGTSALEHHDGPRMVVRIYRVLDAFDPKAPHSPP
jgi:hypothetical protein